MNIRADRFLDQPKSIRESVDFVFNMSKGTRGPAKKSLVPALLDYLGLPYLGSDPYVLSFVRNKAHLKAFAAHLGISTPPFALIADYREIDRASLPPFPLFVKPCYESSSIGINEDSLVQDRASLDSAVRSVNVSYRQPAIVESFLPGREFSVPIIGNATPIPLGVAELTLEGGATLENRFLTSEIVYRYRYGLEPAAEFPASQEMMRTAVTLFQAVGMRDYGRVDFRLDAEGRPFLLEASTHPHLARHSDFAVLSQSKGLDYTTFLRELLSASFLRCGLGWSNLTKS